MKKSLKHYLPLFLFSLFLVFPINVFAETNEGSNMVQLTSAISADNSFNLYISTSDTELGDLILSGTDVRQIYQCNYQIAPGKTYYLHIEAKDIGGIAGLIGKFELNSSGLKFKNDSKILTTSTNSFKVSKTGFGKNYSTPSLCTYNYNSISSAGSTLSPAKWIWTNSGKDINCTRYFTAEIVPEIAAAPTNLEANAGDSQVILTWNAVIGAESYNIKRSTVSGKEEYVNTVTGSAITFTDTAVTNGVTYYYVVSAVNSAGESMDSNEASATPTVPIIDNKLKLILECNEERQLSVSKDLSKNTEMLWLSSDANIATVDENGVIKALKLGNTVITCTDNKGSYIETINILVIELDLQLAVDLTIGSSCRLTVDDLANITAVTWVTDNPAIAIVSDTGKVTAISEGLTFITAIDDQNNEIGKIYVRVR